MSQSLLNGHLESALTESEARIGQPFLANSIAVSNCLRCGISRRINWKRRSPLCVDCRSLVRGTPDELVYYGVEGEQG